MSGITTGAAVVKVRIHESTYKVNNHHQFPFLYIKKYNPNLCFRRTAWKICVSLSSFLALPFVAVGNSSVLISH